MSMSLAKQHSFVACAGALALAPAALPAEWQIAPTASVFTDYTDNPRLVSDHEIATTGRVGELSAIVQRRTEVSELSLTPRLRSSRYSEDDALGSDDSYLDASWQLATERTRWGVNAGYVRDTTLTSELQLTGLVQSNRRHEGINVSGGPMFSFSDRASAGLQAFWFDNHYTDALSVGLFDYGYRGLSLSSSYAGSDQSVFTLKLQGGALHVPIIPSADKEDASARLGWKYQTSALWSIDVSAGPSFVKSKTSSDRGAVYEFGASRQGERWTFTASAGRDLTPTGRGSVTQSDQVSLALDSRLTERLSAHIQVAANRNRDLLHESVAAADQVSYGRVEARVNWQFAERWQLSFAVSGSTLKYESSPERPESYRTYVGLVWNGLPRYL
jgi:hypothetical protein